QIPFSFYAPVRSAFLSAYSVRSRADRGQLAGNQPRFPESPPLRIAVPGVGGDARCHRLPRVRAWTDVQTFRRARSRGGVHADLLPARLLLQRQRRLAVSRKIKTPVG